MHRCVFLDRDGVINFKPAQGAYIHTWGEFRLIPTVIDWIRLFNALGLLVIIVTNQRGVALGQIDPGELARIHDNMKQKLLGLGARIDDIFCCVHEEHTCNCRKPRPGMVMATARKWDIDLRRSLLIGDSTRDEELALVCGCLSLQLMKEKVKAVVRRQGRESMTIKLPDVRTQEIE
jgi:D-glycero-D-manno-heptose 1,7-bisphosphate phosphatase